jgi:hypothetical protein
MSNVTIFKSKDTVVSAGPRELSDFAKSLSTGGTTSRRIQTNTNGTFKRIINGEQIGNAVRGEINVIILHALPKVSRIYYAEKFDPNKEATLPDCWSNLGDKPEAAASNAQHTNCADCSMNIKGSGDNGGRACRFQRRISVLLADDPSGDVYQFNVPAKSLFGKGEGNVHPFESYIKFLNGNGESLDNVVTNASFDLNADTMQLVFTPLRNTTDAEYALVKEAQKRPESRSYTMLTVAQTDGVKTLPPAAIAAPKPAPVVVASDEPDDEEDVPAPVKRPGKKAAAPIEGKNILADAVEVWGKGDK